MVPGARFPPGADRSVVDLTLGRLTYRELIVTGLGFQLVITVSTTRNDQPSNASVVVNGYQVSFLCSGPPRLCPGTPTLKRLALDPRLVAQQ